MAVDPNTLLADAVCYACQPGNAWAFKLALLKQILLAVNPMADTSPNALLELAKCYSCQPGNAESFELALLQQIVNAGGASGSGGVTCGAGAPSVAPASGCGLYVNTTNGAIYTYYSGAWH